jgi:membrane-bound serine protease (ClpP class)
MRTHAARGALLLTLAMLAALSLSAALAGRSARADGSHVDTVTFARDVDPASARFLDDAIATASSDGATALIITIDTPGGDLDSMKDIVQHELASAVPIITYVAPQGARAGSAGTFVTLAAPLAVMAPNTRIGAASPIDSTGADIPSTLDRKLKNDLEAQMRAMQTTFNRNVPLAVNTIETAASYDDQEAISQGLVNFGATTQEDLLQKLDGMSVTLANGSNVTLHTAGLPVQTIDPTLANQLEAIFLDPTLLFILFIIAAICIYLELAHPGAIVPGTIGAIVLVIFLFGSGFLNPNWAGLVLMLLAIVLLAIDVRVPTHGVLTVGALISLIAGSLIFFDSNAGPGAQTVSPIVIGATAVGVGLVSLLVISFAVRSHRMPVGTGSEGLVGAEATVTIPLAPEGRVRVMGEDWAARVATPGTPQPPVAVGQQVRVKGRDGLLLIVEPLPK